MNLVEQFRTGAFADPATPLGAIIYALTFALLAWLIGRALRLAIHRLLAYDKRALVDRTTVKFLGQLAQIGVYLFAFISYAHLVPSLSHLGTAWLASVSVISVVVGLAAQSTLGNLISGISLLLYRPFNVGDRLQLTTPSGVETAEVESLNLGYTILKTDDNRRIVVPNSIMASQTTVNLTGNDPRSLCSIPFPISCDADIDLARSILLELARAHPQAQKVTGCPVTQVSPAGVVLTLNVWCPQSDAAYTVKCDLLEQARKRFLQEGIHLPFARTTVTLEGTKEEGDEPHARVSANQTPPK